LRYVGLEHGLNLYPYKKGGVNNGLILYFMFQVSAFTTAQLFIAAFFIVNKALHPIIVNKAPHHIIIVNKASHHRWK